MFDDEYESRKHYMMFMLILERKGEGGKQREGKRKH